MATRASSHALRGAASRPFETLEPRRMMAADLVIENISVVGGSTEPALAGQPFTIRYTIANRGNSSSGAFAVAPVQSDNVVPGGLEEILFTRVFQSLAAGQAFTDQFTYTPVYNSFFDADDNTGHIALYADVFNAVPESNERNNSGRGLGIDAIAFRVEGNLVRNPGVGVFPDATPLPANGIVSAVIGDELSAARDIDTFALDVTAGRFYEVDVDTTVIGGLDTVVRVYDNNFNLVASNDDGGYGPRTVDPYLQFSTGSSGRYYVVVSSKQNAAAEPRMLAGRNIGATGQYQMLARQLALPTVKLRTGPTAMEGNPSRPATITVTRTDAPLDRDLFVKWEVFGSATLADLDIPANGVNIPAGESSVTLSVVPTADGIAEPLEFMTINLLPDQRYVRDPVLSSAAVFIEDDPATNLPDVVNAFFAFNNFNGTFYVLEFDQPVTGFDSADVQLVNLTTGALVTAFNAQAFNSTTCRLDFRGFSPGNTLADGNYRLTLRADAVSGAAGTRNLAQSFDFFVLGGDANRDRKVDIGDFATLASRFNGTGNFIDGDFNYSGRVDIGDFAILAASFNRSLVGASPASVFGRASIEPTDRLIGEIL